MEKKQNRFVKHIKDNKSLYISNAITLATGVSVGIIMKDSATVFNKPLSVNWKTADVFVNNIQLARRGHPGFHILCETTGEQFASMARAAEATGVSRKSISDVCKRTKDSVKGLKFVKLGETA